MVRLFQLQHLIQSQAQSRWRWFVGIHLFILGLYLFTNRMHLYEPIYLERSWLDLTTPLVPLSIWIYLSYYFSFTSIFFWEKDLDYLNRFAYAFLALNIACNLVFFVFPTSYDRSDVVLPESSDKLTMTAFALLHWLDRPANCLPSLHVGNIFLAAFVWYGRYSLRFYMFLVWAGLVSLSTLTTKQHYAVDVILGFLFALLAYRFFFIKLQFRR